MDRLSSLRRIGGHTSRSAAPRTRKLTTVHSDDLQYSYHSTVMYLVFVSTIQIHVYIVLYILKCSIKHSLHYGYGSSAIAPCFFLKLHGRDGLLRPVCLLCLCIFKSQTCSVKHLGSVKTLKQCRNADETRINELSPRQCPCEYTVYKIAPRLAIQQFGHALLGPYLNQF